MSRAQAPKTSSRVGRGNSRGDSRAQAPAGAVKQTFKVDLSSVAGDDDVFHPTLLRSYEQFLKSSIKVNGKAGNLGDRVKVQLDDQVITVTSYSHMKKCYIKYLTKRFLQKNRVRNFMRIIATRKNTYELQYRSLGEDEDAE